MSKIFEAYKKRTGGDPDLAFELTRSGEVALFPTPPSRQLAEFSELANMMLRLRRPETGLVLSFASSVSGEGSSYVSYNAALQLAHTLNQKVIWIDANFKSPQRKLYSSRNLTFAAVLQEPESLRDLAPDNNLTLVPGGADLPRHTSVFASQTFPSMLRYLSGKFDFTIIDMPPILESVETGLMAVATDGMLIVIESKRLKWEVVKHGLDSLQEKHVKVLGTVINRREYDLPKIIYDRI
ncbi:MAG: CpsD/CapB family tyrosine-protein kinase [bacterium]